MITIGRFSVGIGDRFTREGAAQLAAFVKAREQGVEVTPVWNKSNREHQIVGTHPDSVRAEADAAVKQLGWRGAYHVDADHIGLKTVDKFLAGSDFFTIDVADTIGQPAFPESVAAFVQKHRSLTGKLQIPGVPQPFELSESDVATIARKYLLAAQEAGEVYRHIAQAKGTDNFIAEVSMDETDRPQTPVELLVILAALAGAGVRVQTIAPKFTGRFNKGVDYVGDPAQFAREFADDLAVVAFAVREFGLPASLKLSVHSGSDKFSLYPIIRRELRRTGAGVHLKTAGTTWLEEVAGLALARGDPLKLAQGMYADMHGRIDELSKPYATVIDIDRSKLPAPATVQTWSGEEFAGALRHDQRNSRFNPHFRQLIHVGFRVAAERGAEYTGALEAQRTGIAKLVTDNLYTNHLRPLLVETG